MNFHFAGNQDVLILYVRNTAVKRCGLPLPWGHDSENDGRSSIGGIFSNSLIKREA